VHKTRLTLVTLKLCRLSRSAQVLQAPILGTLEKRQPAPARRLADVRTVGVWLEVRHAMNRCLEFLRWLKYSSRA